MKRLWMVLIICIAGISYLPAQSTLKMGISEEGKIYLLPRPLTSYTLEVPEIKYQELYTSTIYSKKKLSFSDFQEEESLQVADLPMNMQILSGAYKPFFNIYAPLYLRTNPVAFDFFESFGYPLEDNFTFIVSGFQSTWPGSGSLNTVNAAISWSNEKWEIWGGGFAGRFATPYAISPGLTTGVIGGVNYQATEWLKLKTWGEYTHYDKNGRNNMFLFWDDRQKQTAIGGAMEFKVNDNFGFGIGIQHNRNPMRNRWERNGFIYPTFRNNNRIGFSVNPGY